MSIREQMESKAIRMNRNTSRLTADEYLMVPLPDACEVAQATIEELEGLIRALTKGGYAGSSDPCYFACYPVTLSREHRDLLTSVLS